MPIEIALAHRGGVHERRETRISEKQDQDSDKAKLDPASLPAAHRLRTLGDQEEESRDQLEDQASVKRDIACIAEATMARMIGKTRIAQAAPRPPRQRPRTQQQ